MHKTDRRISTHTPLARRDSDGRGPKVHGQKFLLTRLLRGVTKKGCHGVGGERFLLTRLLRGVTSVGAEAITAADFYSHASCEA